MILNFKFKNSMFQRSDKWRVVTGSEIAQKITKGSSPKWQGFAYQHSGILFVTSENVRDGFLDISNPKYLPLDFNAKAQASVLQNGDILINIVGASIGRVCKFSGIDHPANVNQAVCVFRCKRSVSTNFVLYFFQSPKGVNRLLSSQVDSARPNVSLTDIREMPFPLPPLPEQKAIAAVLQCWDRGIQKLEAKLAAKERVKKGLIQQLLSGEMRMPGFGIEGRMADGGWQMPEGWSAVTLGDLGTFSKGIGISKAELSPEGLPCLRYGEIYTTTDFVLNRFRSFVPESVAATSKRIRYNDLLFAGSGETAEEIGKCLAYLRKGEEAYAGGDIVILSVKTKTARADYLSYFLNTIGRKQLNRLGQGQSVVHLYSRNLSRVEVSLPPFKEQEAIVRVLSAADREIEALRRKLEARKAQKRYLLNNLVDGTIRLPQFVESETEVAG